MGLWVCAVVCVCLVMLFVALAVGFFMGLCAAFTGACLFSLWVYC